MQTKILLACLLGSACLSLVNTTAEQETKYLAFQIFTTYSTDPKDAQALNNGMREPLPPGTAALREYVLDIKQRIGILGDRQTRLAVMLGPLCFDQTDAEITRFIERAFDLALETDMAVGFHIDDCILWSGRKDLWRDPQNVEALDWDGTPCTGRRLNYSKTPMEVAPQMCFNSKAVQHEVRQRAALIGKAIAAGVQKLEQLKRPEMFVGVISGWETQMGSDLKTGKYLGYRALLNRGFSREHPPQDQSLELEKVTQEFIELWTAGLAEAGAPPQKIYSHIAFLSRRAFGMGDSKEVTYMRRDKDTAYSQHNHYTPPSVAFGKGHRPGFSTYPQPGLFEDIYELVEKHQQVGWASSEGTNMQPGTGPGQTGMNMETYLAKMFNHGATLTTIFSWGIGGEAHKNMSYRLCTEGAEELKAYRKFLRGEPLIEGVTVAGLQERLPLKVHKIQAELPAWMQKADPDNKAKAMALMQKLQQQAKGRDPLALEQTADALLKLMGVSAQPSTQSSEIKRQQTPPSSSSSDDPKTRLTEKVERVKQGVQTWTASGRDPSDIIRTMHEKFKPLVDAGKVSEAEAELDRVLEALGQDAISTAAADASKTPANPVVAGVFPPELVFLAQDRIALTPEQLETFRARLGKTPMSSGGAAVSVKDLLTPEQLTKMGHLAVEMTKDHAVFLKLEEEAGKRISAKAERVKVGAQQWTVSGHDASAILKAIEEQYKPLMAADKVFEAEAVLDGALKLLKQDGKSAGTSPATSADLPPPAVGASQSQDEEARKHWLHNLGGPFFVSRDPVQDDLRLSDDQKQKLRAKLSADVQEAKAVQSLKPGEREQAMRSLRQKSYPILETFLQETLTSDQLKRFQQLKRQYDIPSVMLQPDIGKELNLTGEQQKQFMGLIQEMQKAIMPLLKEAQSGGSPQEILPKVTKLRLDCQAKIEALLSDPQKRQWKEMTGRPLVIW